MFKKNPKIKDLYPKCRSDKHLIDLEDLKNVSESIESATRGISDLNLEKHHSHLNNRNDRLDRIDKQDRLDRQDRQDLDRSNISSSHDEFNSQNQSLDRGGRLSSFEECSNLQNIVKQSVAGIFDMLNNNSTKHSDNNNNNPSKRKKIEYIPTKKFDVIEEKEEEQQFKNSKNSHKNTNCENSNKTPIIKKSIRKNLLYSSKNNNKGGNISNLEIQLTEDNIAMGVQNPFKQVNSNINTNPTTPNKKDAFINFKERRNKMLKDGKDSKDNERGSHLNDKDMMNDLNLALKGVGKAMEALQSKNLPNSKQSSDSNVVGVLKEKKVVKSIADKHKEKEKDKEMAKDKEKDSKTKEKDKAKEKDSNKNLNTQKTSEPNIVKKAYKPLTGTNLKKIVSTNLYN